MVNKYNEFCITWRFKLAKVKRAGNIRHRQTFLREAH